MKQCSVQAVAELMAAIRLSEDAQGVPGIHCATLAQTYHGLGQLHARLRPLQTLTLATAGRGQLMYALWPTPETRHIDLAVARLQLDRHAQAAVRALPADARALLDAYAEGVAEGFAACPLPWWQALLFGRMRPPCAESVAAGLLLSAWLGQGEGQARMERALVALVQRGAEAPLLASILGPLVGGLDVALLQQVVATALPAQPASASAGVGGSNAWAVGPARARAGHAMLAGDPHQPIGALPGMFLQVRVAMAEANFLLGASIPGLPGFIVGRSRTLAWSGTFAFADNFDHAIEDIADGRARRPASLGGDVPLNCEVRTIRRRFRSALKLHTHSVGNAPLVLPDERRKDAGAQVPAGLYLTEHWAATQGLASTIAAYLQLPSEPTVAAAQQRLAGTDTLNLQFVLADSQGQICRQQAGALPQRPNGGLGFLPKPGWEGPVWLSACSPAQAPRLGAGTADEAGVVVAANDGELPWATLPQPDYRSARIQALLARAPHHDRATFVAMQADLYSLQAQALLPVLQPFLGPGPTQVALQTWDFRYDAASTGAHAFTCVWWACVRALAPFLGGDAWHALLDHSELGAWWCKYIDAYLLAPAAWAAPQRTALLAALHAVGARVPQPWGEVQRLHTRHEIWGTRAGRGVWTLPGSLATICQGNAGPGSLGPQAIAPALRLVCDFSEDALRCIVAGGHDESPKSCFYASNLQAWHAGELYCLRPPHAGEASLQHAPRRRAPC